MSITATAKVFGLADLTKALAEIDSESKRNIIPATLREIAKPVQERAKQLVPVLTGKLRDSIRLSTGGPKKSGEARINVITRVPYWGQVEFGNVHQSAQPFLRPALIEQATELVNKFGAGYKKRIERLARKVDRARR